MQEQEIIEWMSKKLFKEAMSQHEQMIESIKDIITCFNNVFKAKNEIDIAIAKDRAKISTESFGQHKRKFEAAMNELNRALVYQK